MWSARAGHQMVLQEEIRILRQRQNRFSESKPEEDDRLQEAERLKQVLQERMELRERQK